MGSVGLYDLFLLGHVLIFVYWLGADLAVFYGASYAANPALSGETRRIVSEIMAFVDLFPRLSVPLIAAFGFSLAEMSGRIAVGFPLWTIVWPVALLWFANTFAIYAWRKDSQRIAPLRRIDFWMRIVVLVVVGTYGFVGLFGGGGILSQSIAAKMIVYALAIVFSLMLRYAFMPYRPALNHILEHGSTPEQEAIMSKALNIGRPLVVAIWLSTVVAAALGLWQPI